VVVESAMCESGLLHDVGDSDIFHAMQSEHPRCGFDNEMPILFGLFFS
jgi:hypothetical protein